MTHVQGELFDRQTGEILREVGVDRVEESSSEFVATMRLLAVKISEDRGSVTSDDLRKIAEERGLRPCHRNAWGAIFRGKGWRVVGRRKSELASNHAREIRVWKWEGSR